MLLCDVELWAIATIEEKGMSYGHVEFNISCANPLRAR